MYAYQLYMLLIVASYYIKSQLAIGIVASYVAACGSKFTVRELTIAQLDGCNENVQQHSIQFHYCSQTIACVSLLTYCISPVSYLLSSNAFTHSVEINHSQLYMTGICLTHACNCIKGQLLQPQILSNRVIIDIAIIASKVQKNLWPDTSYVLHYILISHTTEVHSYITICQKAWYISLTK